MTERKNNQVSPPQPQLDESQLCCRYSNVLQERLCSALIPWHLHVAFRRVRKATWAAAMRIYWLPAIFIAHASLHAQSQMFIWSQPLALFLSCLQSQYNGCASSCLWRRRQATWKGWLTDSSALMKRCAHPSRNTAAFVLKNLLAHLSIDTNDRYINIPQLNFPSGDKDADQRGGSRCTHATFVRNINKHFTNWNINFRTMAKWEIVK